MHFRELPLEIQFRILKQAGIQELQCLIHAGVLQPGQGLINYFADIPESSEKLRVIPTRLPAAQPRAFINVVEISHPDRWDISSLANQLSLDHNLILIYGKDPTESAPIEGSGWNLDGFPKLTAWNPKLHMLLRKLPEAHYSIKLYDTVLISCQILASPFMAFELCAHVVLSRCKASKKFTMLGTGRDTDLTISGCDDSVLQHMDITRGGISTLQILGDSLTLKDCVLPCKRFVSYNNVTGKPGKTFKEVSGVTFEGSFMNLDLSHGDATLRKLMARRLITLHLMVGSAMPVISGLDLPKLEHLVICNSLDDRGPVGPEGVVDYSFCRSVKTLKLVGIIDPLFHAPLDSMRELEIEYNDSILGVTRRFNELHWLTITCGPRFRELGRVDAPTLYGLAVRRSSGNHDDSPLRFVCHTAIYVSCLLRLIINDSHPGAQSIDLTTVIRAKLDTLTVLTVKGVDMTVFESKICFRSLRSLMISGRHTDGVLRLRFQAPRLDVLVIHLHHQTVEVTGFNRILKFEVTADELIGHKPRRKSHKFIRCNNCELERDVYPTTF